MSRFFKGVSDSESESSDAESDVQIRPAHTTVFPVSDDEEEAKRVVKTEKEKRYSELHYIIKQIRNHKKIKDISKMLSGFENLTRAFLKAKPVIEREENNQTPKFYLKCLVELETFVHETWQDREGRKNMSKPNSKSLAALRQKLKKYLKDFEEEMNSYKASPLEDEKETDEEQEESGDESSDEEDNKFAKAGKLGDGDRVTAEEFLKTGRDGSDDDSDDHSYWQPSSDSDSYDSEKDGMQLARAFLKPDVKEAAKKDKKKERKEGAREETRKKKADEPEDGGWEKVRGGVITGEKPKMFAKDEEINHQSVLKKLHEILAMRGKKRIHRSDQIEMLSQLREISVAQNLGPAMDVKILLGIIVALFDYNPNNALCMKHEMWQKCLTFCQSLLDILLENLSIILSENVVEESESFVEPNYRVHGCALTLIERMDEEFTKILQAVDPHSPDYIERLKAEQTVCHIIESLQKYLETNQRGTSSELCRVYILRIDHLYYKFDPIVFEKKDIMGKFKLTGYTKTKELEITEEEKAKLELIGETSLDIMDKLCKYIYANDITDRIRTQAILCHIYHHALHDNWFEARDLMLMSQLQYNIQRADIPLHVLYNRALVQLGLCAFRHGNIRDAHQDLLDIQLFGKAKELLAQGLVPRMQDRTPEQEKMEKRRLLPFHKHINIELIECVYLVSAMLLEISDVAANEHLVRKKVISRPFYNQLRKNEEQPLVGLPESMREHVVAASKAMRVGDWKICRDFIINDKMNAKVWNLFHQSDRVKEMLVQKIREESLRSFLFTYSHVYDRISLNLLGEMFDLETNVVHSIISKMIINEDQLMASLDEPTQMLIMHKTEPSRIQGMSLQLADRVNHLVEQNEKIWEFKQMGFFGAGQQGGPRMGYNQRGSDAQNQPYRDYNNQRQDRNYNRDNNDQRQNRNYNRDNQRQDRNFNRDNQRQDRNYNRDNRRQQYVRG